LLYNIDIKDWFFFCSIMDFNRRWPS